MARKLVFAVIAMGLTVSVASAQKIYVDYDPGYDRDKIETFAWSDSPETAVDNPLMHSRLVNAVEHYLAQGGLREDTSDPDIWVTYHTNAKQELRLDTSTWGYGYSGSMYWDPYWPGYYGSRWGTSTTTVREYTRGTLIIDIWAADTKQLIWRGSASGIVPDSPSRQEKQLNKSIDKMVRKWQSMKKKDEKARAKAGR